MGTFKVNVPLNESVSNILEYFSYIFVLQTYLKDTHKLHHVCSNRKWQRIWFDQTHEGLRRSGSSCWNERGLSCTMHQNVVEVQEVQWRKHHRKPAFNFKNKF